MKKILLLIFIVIFGAGFWFLSRNSEGLSHPRPNFEYSNMTITGKEGRALSFTAEVAKTKEEKEYGLMFLRKMPDDQGMIFLFSPPEPAAFWMKNTLIPLDMIFVSPNGTIESIAENAKPEDLTPILSKDPVIAVIEINGGLAAKEGIKVGDKVESPIFQGSP